ncbi:hypothetical protein N9G63_01435 [Chitinophagales bacterium]|nr:hypothetical protein [Chitinophagales bacterium]
MKNLLCLLSSFIVACAVFGQKHVWELNVSTGFNLSINRMHTLQGENRFMTNAIRPGGYWSITGKHSFSNKTQLFFGIDQAAYKYHYRYRIDQGNGGAARSSVYIWGLPIGIENLWIKKQIGFSTSYGIKYRFNRFGSPISLKATNSVYNSAGELVYGQVLQEDRYKQNDHLIALILGANVYFFVKERFAVSINLSYTQGLNTHESFHFTANNNNLISETSSIDQYKYNSKASYFALGLGFNIKLNHKQNETEDSNEITLSS